MSDKTNQGGHASADELDQRLKRVDETRWIASRYAPQPARRRLVALYLLNHELARAAHLSEPMLGAIRLQWWREALSEVEQGRPPRRHEVLAELDHAFAGKVAELKGLTALIEHWQAMIDDPSKADGQEDHALIPLAIQTLTLETPGSPPAIDTAAVLDRTSTLELEPIEYVLRPAFLHLAAHTSEGAKTSGLQARWRMFRKMLLTPTKT